MIPQRGTFLQVHYLHHQLQSYHNPKNIFILGMPRSGTTLVEQIISSHSRVNGAGELKYVPLFVDNIAVVAVLTLDRLAYYGIWI